MTDDIVKSALDLLGQALTRYTSETALWWIGPRELWRQWLMAGKTSISWVEGQEKSQELLDREAEVLERVKKHGTPDEMCGLPLYVDDRMSDDLGYLIAYTPGIGKETAGIIRLPRRH